MGRKNTKKKSRKSGADRLGELIMLIRADRVDDLRRVIQVLPEATSYWNLIDSKFDGSTHRGLLGYLFDERRQAMFDLVISCLDARPRLRPQLFTQMVTVDDFDHLPIGRRFVCTGWPSMLNEKRFESVVGKIIVEMATVSGLLAHPKTLPQLIECGMIGKLVAEATDDQRDRLDQLLFRYSIKNHRSMKRVPLTPEIEWEVFTRIFDRADGSWRSARSSIINRSLFEFGGSDEEFRSRVDWFRERLSDRIPASKKRVEQLLKLTDVQIATAAPLFDPSPLRNPSTWPTSRAERRQVIDRLPIDWLLQDGPMATYEFYLQLHQRDGFNGFTRLINRNYEPSDNELEIGAEEITDSDGGEVGIEMFGHSFESVICRAFEGPFEREVRQFFPEARCTRAFYQRLAPELVTWDWPKIDIYLRVERSVAETVDLLTVELEGRRVLDHLIDRIGRWRMEGYMSAEVRELLFPPKPLFTGAKDDPAAWSEFIDGLRQRQKWTTNQQNQLSRLEFPETVTSETECGVCYLRKARVGYRCGHRLCFVCHQRISASCPFCRGSITTAVSYDTAIELPEKSMKVEES